MNVQIGSGKYGTVYKVCLNKECKNKIVRKNSTNNLSFEYRIMKLIYPLAPEGIVEPIKFQKGSLYLEHVNMNNKSSIHSVEKVRKILKETIKTLLKIQEKYPSFRHNDLHWDNIFNSKDNTKIYLGDFGFSNIQLKGYKNPLVQGGMYIEQYGIGPKPNQKYDIALLLNDIHMRGTPEVKKYIEKLVPSEYLQTENTKVINGRMRYNADHTNFPSLKKILSKLQKMTSKVPKNLTNATIQEYCGKRPAPYRMGSKGMKTLEIQVFIEDKAPREIKEELFRLKK